MGNSMLWIRCTVFSSSKENCQYLFYILKSVWNFPLKCALQSFDYMAKRSLFVISQLVLSVAETKVDNTFMLFHLFCLLLFLCEIGSKSNYFLFYLKNNILYFLKPQFQNFNDFNLEAGRRYLFQYRFPGCRAKREAEGWTVVFIFHSPAVVQVTCSLCFLP